MNRHERRRPERRNIGLIQAIGNAELIHDPLFGEGLIDWIFAYASPRPPVCTVCEAPFLVGTVPASWLRMVFDDGANMALGALCGSCNAQDHRVLGERLMAALRQTGIMPNARLVNEANLHLDRWGQA